MKRPLVEAVRREESAGTTRSTSQPTPHLVSYTTANNVKNAILSNSPDQQQYQDPAVAWRRIFKHTDSGHAGGAAGSTVAQKLEMERNPQSRKRGRPMGTKNSCSKPKAIRGVKARRMETPTVEGQSNPLPQVDCNANHNYTNTNSNDNTTTNIMASNNNYTPSNCNYSTERTSPPNCPISSNNNNNCDSPPHIIQHSTVSAHSRNSINNNIPDNSHANIQDSYKHKAPATTLLVVAVERRDALPLGGD